MWAIAAPARAASIAASAIWPGATGTRSLRPVVSPAPVTAHVMKTSGFSAHRFSYTETCAGLSAVNGSRRQPAQRSRSRRPAKRAMRSSSAGHA